MPKKLFTKDQERAIAFKYSKGVWIKDLATTFGCSTGCIEGILARRGVKLDENKRRGMAAKKKKKSKSAVTLGKILVLHRDGYSIKEIAKYTKATKVQVAKTINAFLVTKPISEELLDLLGD